MLSPLRTGTPSGTTAPACHMCSGPQGGAPSPRTQTTVRQNAPGATTSKPGVLGPAPPVLLLLTTQYPSFREPIWAEMLQDAGLGPLPSPHLGAPGEPGAPGPAPEARLGLGSQDHAGPVLSTSADTQPASRQDKTRDSQPPPAADSLPPREPGWAVYPPSTHPTATRAPRRWTRGRHRPHSASLPCSREPRRELSSATSETPDPPRKAGRRRRRGVPAARPRRNFAGATSAARRRGRGRA